MQPDRSREARNRAIAIQHAELLQQRKDTELQVLEAQEELIDFPTGISASHSAPSTQDLERFRSVIAPFQVTDYDALLQERNIADKCGYVFCPRPYRQKNRSVGQYEIMPGGRIMSKADIRRWCSRDCAQRAMFIKVQLQEVPAWERHGGLGPEIEVLHDEDEDGLGEKMKSLQIGDSDADLQTAMAELALERGETKRGFKSGQLLKGGLVVKDDLGPAQAPSTQARGTTNAIEGYEPRMSMNQM